MLLSPEPRPLPAGPRTVPVIGSIVVHAIFFLWLFAAPWAKSHNAYEQLIKPQETHLIFYNFKAKLPDVSPQTKAAEKKALRAEAINKQTIVSSPENAPKSVQMIFHPVPQLKPEPVRPLPNLIALSAPPPPQKEFVPPKPQPAQPQPAHQVAALAPVPELAAKLNTPELPQPPKVSKPFVPPAERQAELTMQVKVADAPTLAPEKTAVGASAAKALEQGSRTMAFRPQPKRSLTASVGAMPDAPVLQSTTASSANIAVVGLNPIDNLKAPLPDGSRRAQFSAGPKLNPDGASSAGKPSGVAVPDLTVRGGDKDAARELIAKAMSPSYNAPSSIENLRASAREGVRHTDPIEENGHPGTRVSGAPDPRFLGRQVFSVAIQSPNLTSHEGSWLMWYADRAELNYRAIISAPQPLHKVDPKYIATAIEDHVEGTVRLAFVISAEGHVYSIETVKGIDARLDKSAAEALQKWLFEPAMREGKPIPVDALVEIPFRLPPPPEK